MKKLIRITCALTASIFCSCEQGQATSEDQKNMDHADVEFEFVMATQDIANTDIRKHGWENLPAEQRNLANVIAFYSKIESGGFDGFYFDSDYLPDMIDELSASLLAVGAIKAEELLRQSMSKFEGGEVPKGLDARIAVAQSYPDEFNPFDELETVFYSDAESYITLLAHYIRSNPSVFQSK